MKLRKSSPSPSPYFLISAEPCRDPDLSLAALGLSYWLTCWEGESITSGQIAAAFPGEGEEAANQLIAAGILEVGSMGRGKKAEPILILHPRSTAKQGKVMRELPPYIHTAASAFYHARTGTGPSRNWFDRLAECWEASKSHDAWGADLEKRLMDFTYEDPILKYFTWDRFVASQFNSHPTTNSLDRPKSSGQSQFD